MATTTLDRFLGRYRLVGRMNELRDQSDAHLLRLFGEHREEAAFELLVRRHGPIVWGTCTRVLNHQQDAEDAF